MHRDTASCKASLPRWVLTTKLEGAPWSSGFAQGDEEC